MSKVISTEAKKAAIEEILSVCFEILPDEENKRILDERLNSMSNQEFTDYLIRLKNEEDVIPMISPNGKGPNLDLKRNLRVAEKIGHKFFERIWMPMPDGSEYLTPHEYLVVQIPVRRMAQVVSKKASIPQDDKTIDDLTGQPTSNSKGAKISYPEVQTLTALGLESTLIEFMKFRGGDEEGFRAMQHSIESTGGVSLNAIYPQSGEVVSVRTVSIYLTGMHLSNTMRG